MSRRLQTSSVPLGRVGAVSGRIEQHVGALVFLMESALRTSLQACRVLRGAGPVFARSGVPGRWTVARGQASGHCELIQAAQGAASRAAPVQQCHEACVHHVAAP